MDFLAEICWLFHQTHFLWSYVLPASLMAFWQGYELHFWNQGLSVTFDTFWRLLKKTGMNVSTKSDVWAIDFLCKSMWPKSSNTVLRSAWFNVCEQLGVSCKHSQNSSSQAVLMWVMEMSQFAQIHMLRFMCCRLFLEISQSNIHIYPKKMSSTKRATSDW